MLSVLAAFTVFAQAGSTAPPYVVKPDWMGVPKAEHFARFYPPRASRYGLEGRATIQCVVDGEGGLTDCRIATEFPVGEGFGDAALKMAPLFRMKPADLDGGSVAGRQARIPMRWVMPGRPVAHLERLQVASACYGQVAHHAQQDPDAKDIWRGLTYWSMVVASAAANSGLRPRAYEAALAAGHAAAEAGTKREGADLEACMAEALKQ